MRTGVREAEEVQRVQRAVFRKSVGRLGSGTLPQPWRRLGDGAEDTINGSAEAAKNGAWCRL